MQERSILFRLLALPLRHKLTAAAIAVAIAGGFFVWARRTPEPHASPALLLFDASAAGQADSVKTGAQQPAAALAQSILTDDVIGVLASHLDLSRAPNESAIAVFRSHLKLDQTGSDMLLMRYVDADVKRAVTATNAVAEVLTAWVPVEQASVPPAAVTAAPTVTPPAQEKATVAPAMHSRHTPGPSDDALLRMEAQLRTMDHRLAALGSERQRLDAAKVAHTAAEKQSSARQPLEAQLAAAQKKLEDLRVRYTDEYPDVETAQERVRDLQQQLAALPPLHNGDPLSTADPQLEAVAKEARQLQTKRDHLTRQIAVEKKRALEPTGTRSAEESQLAGRVDSGAINQVVSPAVIPTTASASPEKYQLGIRIETSPFRLLQRSSYTAAPDQEVSNGMWWGALLGLACALTYMVVAAGRYKPVHGVTMLEQAVAKEVAYLGAVPRMDI